MGVLRGTPSSPRESSLSRSLSHPELCFRVAVDDIEPGFELPLPGDKVKPEILELCMEFLKMYKEEPMTVIPKVSLGAQRRDSSGRCDMSYVTMCSSSSSHVPACQSPVLHGSWCLSAV